MHDNVQKQEKTRIHGVILFNYLFIKIFLFNNRRVKIVVRTVPVIVTE